MTARRQNLAWLSLALLLASGAGARGEALLDERFAKPELDKAWVVSKEDLGGSGEAAFAVEPGKLVVTKLTQTPGADVKSAHPTLAFTRALAKPVAGDFDAQLALGWTGQGAVNDAEPIQYIRLRLLDAKGALVATGGFADAHVSNNGRREAAVGEKAMPTDATIQEAQGTATVDIRRRGDQVVVFWNGQEILSGKSSAAVAKVEVQAQGFWWVNEKRNLFNKVWAKSVRFETP